MSKSRLFFSKSLPLTECARLSYKGREGGRGGGGGFRERLISTPTSGCPYSIRSVRRVPIGFWWINTGRNSAYGRRNVFQWRLGHFLSRHRLTPLLVMPCKLLSCLKLCLISWNVFVGVSYGVIQKPNELFTPLLGENLSTKGRRRLGLPELEEYEPSLSGVTSLEIFCKSVDNLVHTLLAK